MSVAVAGEMSDSKAVTSCVPQGSVSSPVLFLVYVNCVAASLGFAEGHLLTILSFTSVLKKTFASLSFKELQLQRDFRFGILCW